MPHADSNGTSINYEVTGNPDGPWLIFSNSLGTDLGFWDRQVAAFGGDYRIIRYDTRGHGGSDAPAGDYTIDQLGGDAIAVMDAAGAETALFCGLSIGGLTGLWLGINAPERFKRMVVCNTGAKIGTGEIWQQRIDAVLSGGLESIVDAVVDRWFTERFQKAAPEDVAVIQAMILRTPVAGYAGCSAALRDADLRTQIGSIGLPVQIIAGAHDAATPPALSDEIKASINGAPLVTLDAAHLSNIEAEQAFNAALSSFLKG